MSKLMVLFLGAHNNIKTWLCLSDIKWLRCKFVNLLPYKETHKNAFFFCFFLFFCFLQKRESCVLPCSISKNETKFIRSWGDISSVIMIIFAWGSTLMLPMSGKSIAGNSVIFDWVEKYYWWLYQFTTVYKTRRKCLVIPIRHSQVLFWSPCFNRL